MGIIIIIGNLLMLLYKKLVNEQVCQGAVSHHSFVGSRIEEKSPGSWRLCAQTELCPGCLLLPWGTVTPQHRASSSANGAGERWLPGAPAQIKGDVCTSHLMDHRANVS